MFQNIPNPYEISLCMIVKNEKEMLANSIKSALVYFNDIVVVDTGSDDNTKDIAKNHKARVFTFKWINDFSAARNFAAECAVHNWVFCLDADEIITSLDIARLNEFINCQRHVGSVAIRDYESEKNGLFISYKVTRLYNKEYFRFYGKIHEQVKPINQFFDYSIESAPIELLHYGYSKEVMNAKCKLERNSSMLLDELEKAPNDAYLLYQLGKSYFAMNRDINRACDYFERALTQKPDFKLEYVYMLIECYGYALLRTGRYSKSMELVKYREFYDSMPEFRFLLGHIFQNNAKFNEAIECFISCIGKCKGGIGSFLSYYNIGVIYECAGMISDAIEFYYKCSDYNPARARIKILSG